jgi:hypothetical protein
MKRFSVTMAVLVLIGIAAPLFADPATRLENRLKEYFSNLVLEVGQTTNPSEKRALLNESFDRFLTVMDRIQRLPFLKQESREGLARFNAVVQEKRDELNGSAGFVMVADGDLDNFARYAVQDLEQAEARYFVISGAALLVIILILILIL